MLAGLEKKKYREKNSLFLAEGKKLCSEALGNCTVRYAVVREDRAEGELLSLCEKSGGEVIILSEGVFEKISNDAASDGVAFAVEITDNGSEILSEERTIMLDSVRDPGNVGTVIRTAAAFGYDRVILCDCADIYNPKTVRATMGAIFKMNFTVCKEPCEVIAELREKGRRVIAAALGDSALTLGVSMINTTDCFVIGNEGHGVSEAALNSCTNVIKIPMSDKTESLNAAIAASVIMWEQGKAGV